MKCLKKKEEPHGQNICKGDKMSNKDDLLNMGNGNNPNNMKKILIYVAIAFLIFVIAVIGFAIFQNSNNSETNTIIPPAIQTQPKQDNLFKQIPIETQNVQKSQKQNPQTNEKEKIIQNSSTNQTVNNSQNSAQNITETKPEAKPEVSKNQTIKKTKPIVKEVKPVVKKTKPKIKPKPVKKVIKSKKYYIQVAALLRYKKPSKSFLRLITKAGYKYKFFVTYIKLKNERVKVTKILVGPFSNEKTARKALKKIKANITQNAFLFKVK